MSVHRPALPWVAAAVVAAVGGAWWAAASGAGGESSWGRVARGDLVRTAEVSGTLAAAEAVRLGPPPVRDLWEFKISFLAPEGQEVEAGTPVLGFDTSQLEQRLQQLEAESQAAAKELEKLASEESKRREDDALALAEAEARLRRARLKVDVPGELVAAKELRQASIDLELAEREVEAVHRRIEQAELRGEAKRRAVAQRRDRAAERVAELSQQIAAMTVRAPSAGTVIYVTEGRDDKPQVGDGVWQLAKVLEIPDLSHMVAEGWVDEAEIGRLEPGLPVSLHLDAHPDTQYAGRVAALGTTVERRQGVLRGGKQVEVEVELERTDTRTMRPGMRFRGEIEVDRVREVLLVPPEAVVLTPDGPMVRRRTLLGSEAVRPRLGRAGPSGVEVLEGLAAGDEVLLVAEASP